MSDVELDWRTERAIEQAQLDRLGRELAGPQPWQNAVHDLLDNLVAIAETPGGRLPVLRRGPRGDIPDITRKLVLRRDNHHCRRCEASIGLQLDHVVPWSQRGPDRSDNLETLCDWCNNQRSNYLEADHPRRIIGVVAVCDPCVRTHDDRMTVLHDRSGLWFECPRCRVFDGFEFGDDRVPVYCGTCDWTSWVSDPGRIL